MDFNANFTRYNAVGCSESQIEYLTPGGKKDLYFVVTSKLDILLRNLKYSKKIGSSTQPATYPHTLFRDNGNTMRKEI